MTTAVQHQPAMLVTGRSGRQYRAPIYGLNTTFNQVGGVYMFFNVRAPVYVGQTSDFSTRFQNHHKADAIRRAGATCIAAFVVKSEAERLAIEADILGAYHWPCNG